MGSLWYGCKLQVYPCSSTSEGTQSKDGPIFHALTGCDTVSSFNGRGKKTAWSAWQGFPKVTEALEAIMEMPTVLEDEVLALLEQFLVLIYERTSDQLRVNDTRKILLAC